MSLDHDLSLKRLLRPYEPYRGTSVPHKRQQAEASRLGVEVNMLLPKHRTCGDCVHIRRCYALFGCKWVSRSCDWSPSRFVRREEPRT